MGVKNINYDKLREYLNTNVELYSHFNNTYIHSKTTKTYLLTVKDTAHDHEALKKMMPNLLKKLRKEDLSYFSSYEIGYEQTKHNHVDVVCDENYDLEKMIEVYLNNYAIKNNFPNIDIHIRHIKHKTNYGYSMKKFDANQKDSVISNEKDLYGYVNQLNRYFRLYSLFSFHFK